MRPNVNRIVTKFPNGSVVVSDCADTSPAEPKWAHAIMRGPKGEMPPDYVAGDTRWPGATVG